MLMPSIFGENLFDDFMSDFPFFDDRDLRKTERKLYGHNAKRLMKTDIKETDSLNVARYCSIPSSVIPLAAILSVSIL